ncbi:hypothetical protein CLAIMM_04679 [Cladophialophora immunda]|nr:hypothetical protein CLAIMM_04679 [Cladophialophora immunda]
MASESRPASSLSAWATAPRCKIVALETQYCSIPHFGGFNGAYEITRYDQTPKSPVEVVNERLRDADVAIITTFPITASTLAADATPKLRAIMIMAAGTDHVDLDCCKKRGIRVFNSPKACTETVAEHALAMYFATRRRIILTHQQTVHDQWVERKTLVKSLEDPPRKPPLALKEEIIGIVGHGAIGKHIATLCTSLGMVTLISNRKSPTDTIHEMRSPIDGMQSQSAATRCAFQDVLARSTVIFVCVPRHPSTVNLISASELAMMNPRAVLVNVSRGGIVNETDLLDALRSRQIYGAATDVFLAEPAYTGNSVLVEALVNDKDATLPLVVTPHTAWYSEVTLDNLMQSVKDNLEDTLQYSCQWGSTEDGGMDRLSGNDDDKSVRDWFIAETARYGCSHKIDTMGNIFAIRPGENNDLPPIGLGSHLDTQPTGGKYDGILGVNCALEVLKVLHENDVTTYAPLAVINWTNEEGARFPPAMLCSGVWAGVFSTEFGHACSSLDGTTMKKELERIGYIGNVTCSYEANPLTAHFEVHIEQGPILDEAHKAVGVVKGAQSIRWYDLQVKGRAAHTGSTPMDRRSDALLAASKMIVETNRVVTTGAISERGARGTIAVINSLPQSINTIAGQVQMNLDVRSPYDEDVQQIDELLREKFQQICRDHGASVEINCFWESPATMFDEQMVDCVRKAAKAVDCTHEIISGAGHDSVYTARKVPTAMIFTRCRDGVSHNPAEYSRPEDCAVSAQVLLDAYLRYDELLRKKSTTRT